jgi:hypothetical protein
VPPEGSVPDVGTVLGSFLVCEGPETTTCWYVIQGGVAYRICR